MVQCVNKRYSPTTEVREHLLELLQLLNDSRATMTAAHIAGQRNTVSDALSRVSMGDNWRLRSDVIAMIWTLTHPCTMDRFATASNAVLPEFNSYFFETGCAGVDAFS